MIEIEGVDRASIEGHLRGEGCSILPWSDPPGRHWDPHTHDHDEVIGVVEGRIDFEIAGRRYALEPGKILYLPAGTLHAAEVPEDAPCHYLVGSR